MENTSIRQLIAERGNEIIKTHNGEVPTINTGFKVLDEKTRGFPNGGLIIIGARPGMGKTTFAHNLAYNLATLNGPDGGVQLFSSTMPNSEIADRLISEVSGIDTWKIRTNHFGKDDLTIIDTLAENFDDIPFYVDDTTHMAITELTRRVYRARDEQAFNSVIIDDLDLLLPYNHDSANYEQQFDEITHGLRSLAHELKIPIILMAGIPRYDAIDGDPTPTLSSLRQYGSLEKDASAVIFLHRPDYYDYEISNKSDDLDEVRKHITELVIRKNLFGPIGTVEIYFDPEKLKFVPLEDH